MYDRFHEHGTWPLVGAIEHEEYRRTGKPVSLISMLAGVPARFVNYEFHVAGDGKVWLRLRGIRAAVGPDAEELIDVVHAIQRAEQLYQEDRKARLTRAEFVALGFTPGRMALFHQLVQYESYFLGTSNGTPGDLEWTIEIKDTIQHFAGVTTIDDVFRTQDRLEKMEIAARQGIRYPAANVPDPETTTNKDVSGLADFIDPELWEEVGHLVKVGRWGQVASQASIFLESKLRTWLERPTGGTLKSLVVAALRPSGGKLMIGADDGERDGWVNFGLGIALGARNVDTHRMQSRADIRRYAFGVLAAVSLLLTQLKHHYPELAPKPTAVTRKRKRS